MNQQFRLSKVRLTEMNDVLRVRQVVQGAASALELGSFQRTPIATSAVELARNGILHARDSVFVMELFRSAETVFLSVSSHDKGPGIPDEMVDIAYGQKTGPAPSAGPSLGLGLRGIARLADRFSIETGTDATSVTADFAIRTDTEVAELARKISDSLAKLDDADRASAMAEQNKELLHALGERDLMLREVHHRTQNNLTIISSLVRLRQAAAKSDEAKMALSDVSTRIQSIAAVHSELQNAERFDTLELLPFLQLIVDQMANALSTGSPVRCQVSGANPLVSARQAVDLSLLVGELVTNSLKHAFDGHPDPEIMVEIHQEGDDIKLVVRDNGCGLPEGRDLSTGSSLGWQVIRSIPPKHGGTIEVRNLEGLCVTVRCKIDETEF